MTMNYSPIEDPKIEPTDEELEEIEDNLSIIFWDDGYEEWWIKSIIRKYSQRTNR